MLRHAVKIASCLTLGALIATASTAAAAKTHAVLIGASTYRNLPPDKSLRAPANDVRRMRAALLALGIKPEDIALYADGVEGSIADPTAATINQAFDALPKRIAGGDQIVIYMSGHGTQIPDDNGDEDDGFDEAFLPVDAVPPPPGALRFDMTNVIRDDRIGELIDALRAKGAHVWLVVDSCHSGTISRAMNEEQRAKEISAADFGLSVSAASTPAPGAKNPCRHEGRQGDRGLIRRVLCVAVRRDFARARGAARRAARTPELGLGVHRRDDRRAGAWPPRHLSRSARRDRAGDARADSAAHAPDARP